jgi:signal recognition particle receptor subunit beta
MAFIDELNKAVVLRIVYAGPPMSGKTETLRALARLLLGARYNDAMFTPGEAGGRTLFFDWLEYSAGLFQGRKIRCQIVSVPGQAALFARRKALLESADAIVFVVDAHAGRRGQIGRYFRELRQVISRPESEPPLGVVVQANKTDIAGALSNEDLRQAFDDSPQVAMVRTVATDGIGVREAFVQAVGLALARVRELLELNLLQAGDPDISSGEDLLQRLLALEEQQFGQIAAAAPEPAPVAASANEQLAPQRLSAILEAEQQRVRDEPPQPLHGDATGIISDMPRVPDPGVGAGTVWPAVGGRIILHEIAQHRPVMRQLADSAWTAEISDSWRLLSPPEHRFVSEALARDEILRLARLHAGCKGLLSEHRCITFADSGHGDWRIWQVVRRDKTAADLLALALELPAPESVAMELLRIGRVVCGAVEAFREARFPGIVTLDMLALSGGRPVYAGFLPAVMYRNGAAPQPYAGDAAAVLKTELHEAIGMLSRRGEAMPRLLRQLEASQRGDDVDRLVAQTLIEMSLHHGES